MILLLYRFYFETFLFTINVGIFVISSLAQLRRLVCLVTDLFYLYISELNTHSDTE